MMLDINLLPKKTKGLSSQTKLLIFLLVIVYFLVIAFFCVIKPMADKASIKGDISKINESIASYNVTDLEFIDLSERLNSKKEEVARIKVFKENELKVDKLLDNIEENIPSALYLDKFELANGLINISGYSKDYQDIAKFIVKLRSIERVENVVFTTAKLEDPHGQANEGESNSQVYAFDISISIDQPDILNMAGYEAPNTTDLEENNNEEGAENNETN